MANPLLEVKNLKQYFPVRGGFLRRQIGTVHAVDDVSLTVREGETLGLVGESGCGKTTLGRAVTRLYNPTAGQIIFDGRDITHFSREAMRPLRAHLQMIFQDPFESLNPRHSVGEILAEPFIVQGRGTREDRERWVKEILERVGLSAESRHRYPHEFSGGQRQRIGIARAIAPRPKLVVCDEPVSALDVSIQSQVLNLLLNLQKDLGLTFVFIAHGLAAVRHVSDRVAVMYLGKIVEFTDADTIYSAPLHPYTRALIAAIPQSDPAKRSKRIIMQGEVPSPINPPTGCRFHPRCPHARDLCRTTEPLLKAEPNVAKDEHLVACHFAGQV